MEFLNDLDKETRSAVLTVLGMEDPAHTPKEPSRRHAESDPKEPIRKELTQCQYCWKNEAMGLNLLRCGGCKIERYCSKECQKAAWPLHKAKCKLNQRNGPDAANLTKVLRAFTNQHRNTLSEAGSRALELHIDPKRAERDLFAIFLREREGAGWRKETTFWASDACVMEIDGFQGGAEMRSQLEAMKEQQKTMDSSYDIIGIFLVLLINMDARIMNIMPVAFNSDEPVEDPEREDWREWTIKRLNQGIVL